MKLLNQLEIAEQIRRALAEDVAPGQRGRALIRVKEPRMVLAGGFLIERVFRIAGADPRVISLKAEGSELKAGDLLAEVEGQLAGLLIGERTALNFVQLLSAIATTTRRYVDAV